MTTKPTHSSRLTYREKLRCPNCESEDITTKYAGQMPVRVCGSCRLEYVDHEGEAMLGAQPIRCDCCKAPARQIE